PQGGGGGHVGGGTDHHGQHHPAQQGETGLGAGHAEGQHGGQGHHRGGPHHPLDGRGQVVPSQTAHPLADHRQGQDGGQGVGDGHRQGQAADAERADQQHAGDDVDPVLDQVEPDGGLGVLHGLKDPDRVQEGAESREPQREHGQGGRGGVGRGGGLGPVGQDQ